MCMQWTKPLLVRARLILMEVGVDFRSSMVAIWVSGSASIPRSRMSTPCRVTRVSPDPGPSTSFSCPTPSILSSPGAMCAVGRAAHLPKQQCTLHLTLKSTNFSDDWSEFAAPDHALLNRFRAMSCPSTFTPCTDDQQLPCQCFHVISKSYGPTHTASQYIHP